MLANERIPTCQEQVYFQVTQNKATEKVVECVVLAKKVTSAFVKQSVFLPTLQLIWVNTNTFILY